VHIYAYIHISWVQTDSTEMDHKNAKYTNKSDGMMRHVRSGKNTH